MTLGAGGAAPTSGEDSDGEGSDEFKFCSFLVLLGPRSQCKPPTKEGAAAGRETVTAESGTLQTVRRV